MKKSFLKMVMILTAVLATNIAFAQNNISVNPGPEPNLPKKITGASTDANISHCTPGHNYCEGCCQHEIQVAREKATAATQAATGSKPVPKSQDGGQ